MATRGGPVTRRGLFARWQTDDDYVDIAGVTTDDVYDLTTRTRDTFTNVVPVTVVPTAALPVLWSALEQWLNNGVATTTEDMHRLVGAVESLRGQIDALGLD